MYSDWDKISIPASLNQLEFEGRKMRETGATFILPPAVEVPDGLFLMGSNLSEDPEAMDDEIPQHSIHVAAFRMAIYPVTVAEYAYAVQAKAVPEPKAIYNKLTWEQQLEQLDHPIVNVSWNDATAYCMWLAKTVDQPWRLPTEIEWEKAARGMDGRIYPWGNQWDKTRANTNDGGPATSTPVGTYAAMWDASPFGCHDMVGNVWEWCNNLFFLYSPDSISSVDYYFHEDNRVLRGGSWVGTPAGARTAFRECSAIETFSLLIGFRMACGMTT